MWTRGKDKNGTFEIEVYNCEGELALRQDGFKSTHEADRAAEVAQRDILFPRDGVDMNDDDLLAALFA